MRVRIEKWGNTLALRIPEPLAVQLNLTQGAIVQLSLRAGKLVVAPGVEPEITLEALMAGVTPENLHGEIDTGPSVGKEVW